MRGSPSNIPDTLALFNSPIIYRVPILQENSGEPGPWQTVPDNKWRYALVRAPFIWDWRRSLSAHFAGCAFFASARTQTRRKTRVRGALAALSPPPFQFFLPLLFAFCFPFPFPLERAFFDSAARQWSPYRQWLSPRAPAESAATDARLLLFPLLFSDLYKYIFFLFFHLCLSGLHRSISRFLPWAWHLWPRRADSDNARGLDRISPILHRESAVDIISLSFPQRPNY